ncbi:hypothetical protein [Sciscionella sediminilitoris]|uniref:hypothetical protein n=1 Tax=Sciscionella sediminilitoris TaxID=1445613 RepID=UPI0004DEF0AD|nr:hypothetical protein [Sciscionella sp. SE31]
MVAPASAETPAGVDLRKLAARLAWTFLFTVGLVLCCSAIASAAEKPSDGQSGQQQEEHADSSPGLLGGLTKGLTGTLDSTVRSLPVVNQIVRTPEPETPAPKPSHSSSSGGHSSGGLIELPIHGHQSPSHVDASPSASGSYVSVPEKPSKSEPAPAKQEQQTAAKPSKPVEHTTQRHTEPTHPVAASVASNQQMSSAKPDIKPDTSKTTEQRHKQRLPEPVPADQGGPTATQGHSSGSGGGDRGGNGGMFAIPAPADQLTVPSARLADAAYTVRHPRTAPSRPSVSPD